MNVVGSSTGAKRRVMVVVDPSRESAGALQWALYHALLENDELILLHVEPLSASRRRTTLSTFLRRPASSASAAAAAPGGGGGSTDAGNGDHEFLDEMRAKCEAAQPNVKVHIEKAESGSKDKATAILSKTKLLGVDLLVIGQRRSSALRSKLSGSLSIKGIDTAEFLIEKSECLCIGVQKRGQGAGYLLNSKTHKNFWHLV